MKATPAGMSGADRNAATPCGTRATMPAKIRKLMPLPMPRSVMSSPIHIASSVPPARVIIWVSVVGSRMSMGETIWLCDRMAR